MVERLTPLTPASVGTAARWWQRWPDCGVRRRPGRCCMGARGFLVVGGRGIPVRTRERPSSRTVDPRRCAGRDRRTDHRFPGVSGHGNSGGDGPHGGQGVIGAAMLAFAWAAAATLVLLIPDYRLLMAVAYAPIFVVGAPLGWPPASFFDVITWPVVNQFVCIAGGLCWAATALAYQRRSRGACPNCGRTGESTDWTTPANAARWGKWAVAIAVLIPLLYAATRWAWALGIPSGD